MKTAQEPSLMIRSMRDLESALVEERLPITATPPYFAESADPSKVHIITGAGDTFWYDAEQDSDNAWVGAEKEWGERYNTPKLAQAKVILELSELEQRFKEAGFNNFNYLPAEIPGMINWIFINNAMAAGFDAKGCPLLYFGSMKNGNRMPEPALVEFYLRGFGNFTKNLLNGIRVEYAETKEWIMEGKGDQLPMSLPVIANGRQSQERFYHATINCSGRRTHPKSLEEFAAKTGNYVIEIPLSNHLKTGAYHGNVAIFYFRRKEGDRGVCYVPEMLHPDKRGFVYEMFSTFFGGDNVHRITEENRGLYEESLRNITMNVISVGQGKVISSSNNPRTNEYIKKELGLDILPVDMEAIALGGGGLQCCYTAINYTPLQIIEKGKR